MSIEIESAAKALAIPLLNVTDDTLPSKDWLFMGLKVAGHQPHDLEAALVNHQNQGRVEVVLYQQVHYPAQELIRALPGLREWWITLPGISPAELQMAKKPYDAFQDQPKIFGELVTWASHAATFRDDKARYNFPIPLHDVCALRLEAYIGQEYKPKVLADMTPLGDIKQKLLVAGYDVDEIDAMTLTDLLTFLLPPQIPTDPATISPSKGHLMALLRVFTNGVVDDRFRKAAQVLSDDTLTVDEKLWKIDALIPVAPTVSAAKLGELLGVSKQAVMGKPEDTGSWWTKNRRGEKQNEIGRRHTKQQTRAADYESSDVSDDGD
jgi:hypothetical protein